MTVSKTKENVDLKVKLRSGASVVRVRPLFTQDSKFLDGCLSCTFLELDRVGLNTELLPSVHYIPNNFTLFLNAFTFIDLKDVVQLTPDYPAFKYLESSTNWKI